jgi:DNA-directed RNA polymerase subunit H (RpoH/RPB5)
MCEYRKLPIDDVYSSDTVNQKLNHHEFVTILAGTDRKLLIVLIAPESKYATKSADFRKLLKGMPKISPLDVMFVSDEVFTSHIKKVLIEHRSLNPTAYIDDYTYDYFKIEAPLHVNVPKHEIATEAELDEIYRRCFLTKDRFPRIFQSDVQAVWLGLRPGQVTKIMRLSENAGFGPAYRVCVK